MSENDLLEMADDFKKRMESKNLEIKKLKEKLSNSREDFLFSYSEIRNIDIIIHDTEDFLGMIPEEFTDLITSLRAKLSNIMLGYLLADVGGYETDD